jgi:hypothetical protein
MRHEDWKKTTDECRHALRWLIHGHGLVMSYHGDEVEEDLTIEDIDRIIGNVEIFALRWEILKSDLHKLRLGMESSG